MSTTTIQDEADAVTDRLGEAEQVWARTTLTHRRGLLARMQRLVERNARDWVDAAVQIKQIPPDSPLVGEEWLSGPYAVASYLGALQETLARLDEGEDLLGGYDLGEAPGGRLTIEVLPHDIYDRLLLNGFRAEVWMPPGVTADEVRRTAGLAPRHTEQTHGTVLVLGAGNITSIAPLDVIYQLFAENRVVALKLNPVTDAMKPVLEQVFEPFVQLGVVEVLTGGIEIGGALAHHPSVAAVHMTGSEQTHDAIVWGSGEEGLTAKAAGTPQLDKTMTSELGGVGPVIVVPGEWSDADLRYQAQHVATQRLHNSGSNCIAAQVVVLSSDWPQKDAFLDELRAALASAPGRPAWYPGSEQRVSDARDRYEGHAEAVGGAPARTLITGLGLDDAQESAFEDEYFSPVLAVAEIPGTAGDFLDRAVTAANDRLTGTLGANVIIHPDTRRQLGERFEQAVADLRYGTVAVNCWTGVGYLTARASWGAFPGHTLDDVQSGIGVVHNALLLDAPERTVIQGPFRPSPRSLLNRELSISPKPPWFVDNRTAAATAERLTSFAARPRWSALPGIFASALRG